jgi:drug/metabolite transporter (DMT)-like permease
VLLWSSSAAAFSLVNPRNSAKAVVTVEYALAAAALAVLLGLGSLFRVSWIPSWGSAWRSRRHSSKSVWVLVVVFCTLNITHELTYYLGIRSANPFEANALNYLWPLWLFLFSYRTGDQRAARIDLRKAGLLLLAFVGTLIITLFPMNGAGGGRLPAVYGLISSASAAGYMLVFARMSRRYGVSMPPLLMTTLPICAVLLWLANPADTMTKPLFFQSLPVLVYLAVLTIVVPEILWSYAIRDIGGSEPSLSAIQIPLYSTIWLALVKWTMPSYQVLCGGSLILVALWFSTRPRRKSPATGFSKAEDEHE